MLLKEELRKRGKKQYKLLRKFRKARDIATRHTYRNYTCNFLRSKITQHDEYEWFEMHSKNFLAIRIYEWSEKERSMLKVGNY